MPPRADFVCNSKKCQTPEGEVPMYELPVGATHCPVCGSKRIKRLFNAVNVLRGRSPESDPRLTSSSHLQRSTALLQPGMDEADAHRPPKDMRTYAVRAADTTGVGEAGRAKPMSEMEIARTMTQDKRHFGEPVSPSSIVKILSRVPIPTTVVGRDTG